MSRNWLFIFVAAIIVPVIAFVIVTNGMKSSRHAFSYESTIQWKVHGNVELNAESLKRLNDEIADRMFVAGFRDQQYRVVSLGKGRVEAMYLDDKTDLPPALRAKLDAYIRE